MNVNKLSRFLFIFPKKCFGQKYSLQVHFFKFVFREFEIFYEKSIL